MQIYHREQHLTDLYGLLWPHTCASFGNFRLVGNKIVQALKRRVASGQWHGHTIIEITKHVLSKPLVRPCPSSTPRQYYILGTCH